MTPIQTLLKDLEALYQMSGERFYRALGNLMLQHPSLYPDDLQEAYASQEKQAKYIVSAVIGELSASLEVTTQ